MNNHEHLTFAGSDVMINGKTFSEVRHWTATVDREICVDLDIGGRARAQRIPLPR